MSPLFRCTDPDRDYLLPIDYHIGRAIDSELKNGQNHNVLGKQTTKHRHAKFPKK